MKRGIRASGGINEKPIRPSTSSGRAPKLYAGRYVRCSACGIYSTNPLLCVSCGRPRVPGLADDPRRVAHERSGKRGGRPRKEVDLQQVLALRREGRSLREIARQLRLGFGTVHRALEAVCDAPTLIQNHKPSIL